MVFCDPLLALLPVDWCLGGTFCTVAVPEWTTPESPDELTGVPNPRCTRKAKSGRTTISVIITDQKTRQSIQLCFCCSPTGAVYPRPHATWDNPLALWDHERILSQRNPREALDPKPIELALRFVSRLMLLRRRSARSSSPASGGFERGSRG